MRRLLCTLLMLPAFANAGGFFKPAFSYTIDSDDSGTAKEEKTRRMIDLGGGYISDNGLTLMGQYSLEKKKTETTSAGTTSTANSDRTSMGIGGGWTSRKDVGPFVHGIYYLSSEDVQSGVTYKGNGFELDLGMKVAIQKIAIAIQMAYRTFKYKEVTSGSTTTTLTPPRKQTNLDPTIALFIEF